MSRDAVYRFKLEDPDGNTLVPGRRVWIEFTPADDTPLTTPVTYHDLPHAAFVGETEGEAGWEDFVNGMQAAGSLAFDMDLAALKGSTAIEAFRTYVVNPRGDDYTLTFSAGAYARDLPTWMSVSVLVGEVGVDPTTVQFQGVMRPFEERGATIKKGGRVVMRIECVDIGRFVLESMSPRDVAAWALLNGTEDGPHDYVVGDIYEHDGKTYRRMHGDPAAVSDSRRFSGYAFSTTFDAIEAVGTLLMQAFTRRTPCNFAFAHTSSSVPGTAGNTPYDHWTLRDNGYDRDDTAGLTSLPTGNWFIVGKITLTSDSSNLIGGFYYTALDDDEAEAPADTIGSWDTVWDFLVDITGNAITKATWTNTYDSNDYQVGLTFNLVDDALRVAGVETPVEITADDFSSEVQLSIGSKLITRAVAAIPAATENDQSAIFGEPAGTQWVTNDDDYSVPRGFHSLPTGWPEGERAYEHADGDNLDIVTPHLNAMTVFYKSNAGGRLGSSMLIRAHHRSSVYLGDGTVEPAAATFRRPTPTDFRTGAGASWYSNNPDMGDDGFGTPLLLCYLELQLASGMPWTSATALARRFGLPMLTTYSGKLPDALAGVAQLGNRVDATAFPSGNVFIGGTWLGDLPGEPTIAKVAFDILSPKVTASLEGLP